VDNIESLKARTAGFAAKLFPKRGLLQIEDDKPLSFHVLCPESGEYTSQGGIWYRGVGIHYITRARARIVCSEVEKAAAEPCYICERLREMRTRGENTFRFEGPLKIAMNILEVGTEVPRVFLAVRTVGDVIIKGWEENINNGIDIFDPTNSRRWTVTRSKAADSGRIEYQVEADPVPSPIVTGDDVEIQISRILRAGANLDREFRLSTLQEQKEAWSKR
jgi:hypothetical protein